MARIIAKLARKYKTNCPFELARALNIQVWYGDLGECRGYYLRTLRRRYIAINNALSDEWQRFVCAHELGHDRLHKGMSRFFLEEATFFNPGRYEREANQFAVNLLLHQSGTIECHESVENYFARNGIPREMTRYYQSNL
ncbi:ImmA/IrrE family metallo-endopeptidase [Paenibacillus sp. YYML68]|uniref:ImmA/IrrE family metallo-endopeptidase n=1 Tax=Paenibacillus sp. YYML68 TaxID=2909250 RepID=UPI002490D9AE|nr:ImmA/IrrE family metallo-endopeptidase [Paenibacillus sp. YYML68]